MRFLALAPLCSVLIVNAGAKNPESIEEAGRWPFFSEFIQALDCHVRSISGPKRRWLSIIGPLILLHVKDEVTVLELATFEREDVRLVDWNDLSAPPASTQSSYRRKCVRQCEDPYNIHISVEWHGPSHLLIAELGHRACLAMALIPAHSSSGSPFRAVLHYL
jgi:hypothetical protein